MDDEIKKITSLITHKVYQWAKEGILRFILTIFSIFILAPIIIKHLIIFFENLPYSLIFNSIWIFLCKNISTRGLIELIVTILIILSIFYLNKQLQKTQKIKENFRKDLNKWYIPIGSKWSLQKCDSYNGRMLVVSKSEFPGTLKDSYSWYDYKLKFYAKINEGLSVFIRAEDNFNGVMFKITLETFEPYILYNKDYILDEAQKQSLTTVLNKDEWYKFEILIKGNNVKIQVSNYIELQYRIPVGSYEISKEEYTKEKRNNKLTLDTVKRLDKEREKFFDHFFDLVDKHKSESDPAKKEDLRKQIIAEKIPDTTELNIEFPKGSIGFMSEKNIYIRNLEIKKI